MLDGGGNEPPAIRIGFGGAEDGRIVAFRGASCKDELPRFGDPEMPGDLAAGLFQRLGGSLGGAYIELGLK